MVNQVKSLETKKPWLIKVGKKTFFIRNLEDIKRVQEYRDKLELRKKPRR